MEQRSAYVEFMDAVLDFNDEPTPANLERYLTASHALEQAGPWTGSADPSSPRLMPDAD